MQANWDKKYITQLGYHLTQVRCYTYVRCLTSYLNRTAPKMLALASLQWKSCNWKKYKKAFCGKNILELCFEACERLVISSLTLPFRCILGS